MLRFVQDIPLRPGDPSYDLVSEVQDGLDRFRDVPMLICWGRRILSSIDTSSPSGGGASRDAEVHRFADAGHYVLEDAGEEIIPLVRDFLKRRPLA